MNARLRPIVKTPNFAPSLLTPGASSGRPGGYVWQAGIAVNAVNGRQSIWRLTAAFGSVPGDHGYRSRSFSAFSLVPDVLH